MHVTLVHVRVKPDCVEAFKAATLANAHASFGMIKMQYDWSEPRPTRPRN